MKIVVMEVQLIQRNKKLLRVQCLIIGKYMNIINSNFQQIINIFSRRTIDLTDAHLQTYQNQQIQLDQHQDQQYYQLQTNNNDGQSADAIQRLNIKKCDVSDIAFRFKKKSNFYNSISNDTRQQMEQLVDQFSVFNSNVESENDSPGLQHCMKQQDLIQQKQKSLKQCIKESSRYLLELFYLDYLRIVCSFVILLVLTIIQLKYKINEQCSLKYLYENKSKKKLDSLCPIDSYVILNLQNLIVFNCFYCMICELPTCIYQFSNRLTIQKLCVLMSILQTTIDCIFQTLGDYRLVTELQVMVIVITLIYSIISKHNLRIQIQRYLQVIFYMTMMGFIIMLALEIRDTQSFYALMLMQNSTYIVKKISFIYIESRLKSNLQYDDITLYYITIVFIEYVLMFQQLLIKDNSAIQQTISGLNFIIIQIQNITNKSVVYLIYNYFQEKGMKLFQGIILFKYFVVVLVVIYDQIVQFFNGLFIFTVYRYYSKFIERFMSKDNPEGQIQQMKAIQDNGYFEQRINISELDDYTCQQSILAYYLFLVYQLLLLSIAAIQISPNKYVDVQFQLIYYFEDESKNNMTVQNVIILNIVLMVIIFMMVVFRSRKQVKIVKQSTKYQTIYYPVIGGLGSICLMKMGLFEHKYTKQKIRL